MRRAEIAALAFSHVQRDGRWAVVDLVGKGRRIRTLGMPGWTKVAIDAWTQATGLASGYLFRPMRKGDHLDRRADRLTEQAVWVVVSRYDEPLGLDIAPHDLRRTFAKLALKGQARVEQIQVALGHASIQTTQRYLGTELDLHDAPGDRVPLRLA